MKSLSEQTSKATDQISDRIKTLNSEMKEMAEAMKTSKEVVDEGEIIVNTVGEHISSISSQISNVTLRMNDIASSMVEQRQATDEIAQKVSQISDSASHAKDRSEDVISLSDELAAHIDRQFARYEQKTIPNYILLRAKSDHMLWKKNLAEMLVGHSTLKPEELSDHTSCRLGKWYDSVTDQSVRAHDCFKKLLVPHSQVHEHGKAAATKYHAGDHDGAFAEYQKMQDASAEVVKMLDQMIGTTESS